jgi:hypothetical protein
MILQPCSFMPEDSFMSLLKLVESSNAKLVLARSLFFYFIRHTQSFCVFKRNTLYFWLLRNHKIVDLRRQKTARFSFQLLSVQTTYGNMSMQIRSYILDVYMCLCIYFKHFWRRKKIKFSKLYKKELTGVRG